VKAKRSEKPVETMAESTDAGKPLGGRSPRLKLGLLGHPVAHSRSPAIFQALSEMDGKPLDYSCIDVPPERLGAVLRFLSDSGWDGFNVTHPLKERIAGLMDDLKGDAASIHAVNTVKRGKRGWVGYNTDADGLERTLQDYGVELSGKSVAVWGAGGAARAACLAAARRGAARIAIHSRSRDKALALVHDLGRACPGVIAEAKAWQEVSCSDGALWINATPLGSKGSPDAADARWGIPDGARGFACDFVYSDELTPFLRGARQKGLVPVPGSEILVHQALGAWELWTGRSMDRQKMKQAVCRRLNSSRPSGNHAAAAP